MKKELKYFLTIIAVFASTILFLFTLLKKYSFFTFEHFLEVCRQVSSDFLASGLHHIGFGLSALAFFSMVIFFAKAIFSYIKTWRKLTSIMNNKSNIHSKKLSQIIKKNKINKDLLFIVNSEKDVAITIHWSDPKIVLSTGLIEKLEPEELESVVLHEYYHAKYRHPLLLLVSEVISASVFFIPVFKDIHKKFRSILEKEADSFVSSLQNGAVSLDLAISKVEVEERYPTFPTFSRRSEYKLSVKNIYLSTLVVLVGLVLYVFPTQTHATQDGFINSTETCVEGKQCSVHCNSENMSKEEVISTDTQHRIIISSYQSSF